MRFSSTRDSSVCFYRGLGSPIVPEIDPKKVLSTLFANPTTGSSTFERIRAERKSILDLVGRDLQRFSQTLGLEDKSMIQNHLESIREVEREIDGLSAPTCNGPTIPSGSPQNIEDYPKLLSAQVDLITTAFRCDMTRVATLQLTNNNGAYMAYPWLGLGGSGEGVAHNIAHESITLGEEFTSAGPRNKVRVDTWHMEQFAALIKKLKSIPEGSGTMLDNTAVVFANHMGDGRRHDWRDLPVVIAGRCGGAFKTGQNLGTETTPVNTNALYVSLARAMGVNVNVFGDPRFGSGPIAGLMA